MMIDKKDNTNWGAWYLALVFVLLVQIIIFFIITKSFA